MKLWTWWAEIIHSKLELVQNKITQNEILTNLNLNFKDANNLTENEIQDLKLIFHNKLSHIYWDQNNSFNKLFQDDRHTVILFNWLEVAWILSFKLEPQLEFNIPNINNWYLEIKSLLLLNDWVKGKGVVYMLIDNLLKYIIESDLKYDGIFVTVSKNKAQWSYHLMRSIWFNELYSKYNIYSEHNNESFLYLPLNSMIEWKSLDITIKQPYFSQISAWSKTTEGRSGKMYQNLKIWDSIKFTNKSNSITKKITQITHYKTLEEYLSVEWYGNCIPNAKSFEDAIKIYYSIPWYKAKIKDLGIIWIQFKDSE